LDVSAEPSSLSLTWTFPPSCSWRTSESSLTRGSRLQVLHIPPHCHVTAVTSVTRRGYLDHHHVNERRALDVPGFSPLKPSIPSPAVDAIAGPGAYPLLRGPQAADPT
jgi:hypothetical protein